MASDLAMVFGRSVHLGLALRDELEQPQLLEGLGDLGDERAARAGHHHVRGRPPAELLGDLVTVRLRALRIVRTDVDVHEGPAVLVPDLGAEPVDLVIGAFHGNEGRRVYERGDDLAALEVRGNEDVGLESSLGRVRGDGVGQIARGGAGHRVEAELLGLADGHGDHAVLEGPGGMAHRVVLHPQLLDAQLLGQVPRPQQRSEAHRLADGRSGA